MADKTGLNIYPEDGVAEIEPLIDSLLRPEYEELSGAEDSNKPYEELSLFFKLRGLKDVLNSRYGGEAYGTIGELLGQLESMSGFPCSGLPYQETGEIVGVEGEIESIHHRTGEGGFDSLRVRHGSLRGEMEVTNGVETSLDIEIEYFGLLVFDPDATETDLDPDFDYW